MQETTKKILKNGQNIAFVEIVYSRMQWKVLLKERQKEDGSNSFAVLRIIPTLKKSTRVVWIKRVKSALKGLALLEKHYSVLITCTSTVVSIWCTFFHEPTQRKDVLLGTSKYPPQSRKWDSHRTLQDLFRTHGVSTGRFQDILYPVYVLWTSKESTLDQEKGMHSSSSAHGIFHGGSIRMICIYQQDIQGTCYESPEYSGIRMDCRGCPLNICAIWEACAQ